MKTLSVPVVVVLLICATLLTGCGGGGVPVVVKVVNGGQPYSKDKDGDLGLTLATADGMGPSFTGKVNPDGTFKMVGPETDGVKPGKFKATVTVYDTTKGPQSKTLAEPIEITDSTREVVIDLAKLQ
jgi:hypothetical protein